MIQLPFHHVQRRSCNVVLPMFYTFLLLGTIIRLVIYQVNSYTICIPATVVVIGKSPLSSTTISLLSTSRRHITVSNLKIDDNNDDDDDPDTSQIFELISAKKNEENEQQQPKLGIDIGKMLHPLSTQDATELKIAATEIINDAYAEGLDEITKLRNRMEKDLADQRKSMELKSAYLTKQESNKLMNKIDSMTSQFLQKTETSRLQTKLASLADQANVGSGRGIEIGSWGTIGGMTVLTDSNRNGALLGSVNHNMQNQQQQENDENTKFDSTTSGSSRIICIADENQDQYAKQIISPLMNELKSLLPNGLQYDIYKPSSTIPLGGNNADCILVFLTSINDVTTLSSSVERMLRKTVVAGTIMKPPTQIVAISTVGTNRYDQMPYSMQNLMSGGKIEKRKQMEEMIIRLVNNRVVSPPLDYTICKLGEIKTSKTNKPNPFQFSPYDALDGTTDINTVTTILTQAIAYQPYARNATLHFVGTLAANDDYNQDRIIIDECFLQLDGPELLRINVKHNMQDYENVDQIVDELYEYIREWAFLLAQSGKGLTTPIRGNIIPTSSSKTMANRMTIKKQSSNDIQLLFLPTNTGKNYYNKEEETEKKHMGSSSRTTNTSKMGKDGGLQILIEVTHDNILRVRIKRCNYANDAIIKELSEETIISRFKSIIDVWQKQH